MTIPEPSFVLKDCKATEPTLIYLQSKYTANGSPQRVIITTGNKIHPIEWDNVRKRVIVSKKNSDASDINLWLDKIATTFKTVFRNFIIDGIHPNQEQLKNKIEEQLNLKPNVIAPKITLTSFINAFTEECKATKRKNTIKSYVTTINKLKEYGSYCSKQFDFDDITLEWRAGFIKFLQNLGLSKNTEGKHIKNLKVFLNEATERNINKNLSFKSKSFMKPIEEVKKPFLTESEIQRLLEVDLSTKRLYEIVRDYFVIGCYTGLRYADLVNLKPYNIKENNIEIHTEKTEEDVVIPIHPIVKRIFEKYNFNFPKSPANQIFNRYIKEVGKMAELNETFVKTKTLGGIKKTILFQKWELLSSHIGRRSFITNCSLNGINPNAIMLMSGHKSSRVFQSYISMNKKQNADNLKTHDFFKFLISN